MHYRSKRLVAEIMDVSTQQTSLGRLVTARAVSSGKALLSGPADTGSLKTLIQGMKRFDVDTTIVDGALSRLSLSSPAVTEAMVLATEPRYPVIFLNWLEKQNTCMTSFAWRKQSRKLSGN